MDSRKRWYEGGADALDHAIDVGPLNEYEPDQTPDAQNLARKAIAGCMEFAATNPEEIVLECEAQDVLLNLDKGTTLKLFLESVSSTH